MTPTGDDIVLCEIVLLEDDRVLEDDELVDEGKGRDREGRVSRDEVDILDSIGERELRGLRGEEEESDEVSRR